MTITSAAAKHIMNSPETLVSDSLQGLCYTNPNIRVLEKERVVYYANMQEMAKSQVTLISGGGSGHEPGYAGFVGHGGLAASVCGHVFSSPSSSQVLAAIERVQSLHGTLIIIMNYTGDCLNFGLAVERAKTKGIKVELLAIEDDVAIGISKNKKVGRRGMAATALAIKLAGALASRGATLEKVREVVQYAIKNMATLGVALNHCHVPGSSTAASLGPDEIELGMGIHNETGFLKTSMMPAKQLVSHMMDTLIDQNDPERSYLKLSPSSSVVMLVNNLGGIAMLELNVVVKEAVNCVLSKTNFVLERVLVGPFVTSLNMPGFSITLLVLDNDRKEILLDLLDQKVSIPAWPSTPAFSFSTEILGDDDQIKRVASTFVNKEEENGPATDPKVLGAAIMGATKSVIAAELKITEYDTILGDGDCGHTLKTAALAIQEALDTYDLTSAYQTISSIAETIELSVGGTSSAIYCIFLNALASGLIRRENKNDWVLAANHALNTLMSYTKARVGDRTLMDTLCPFIETLNKGSDVEKALVAAQVGTKSTCHLSAQVGRSSYLDNDQVLNANIPDAGAYGLVELLTGLVYGISHPITN